MRTLPTPIFGVGLETNGNIVVGEVVEVARVSPAGVLLRTFSGAFNEIRAVEVSGITVEAAGVTNTPPVLAAITDRTVDENTPLTFAATATDTNWPPQVWTFSLAGNVPAGAAITTNGVFTWTPSEAQGPDTYPITVVVTDDGSPPQSASNTCHCDSERGEHRADDAADYQSNGHRRHTDHISPSPAAMRTCRRRP